MSETFEDIEGPANRLRSIIRQVLPGGCKMLSQGDGCGCPLCDIDRLVRLAYRFKNLQRKQDKQDAKG